MIGGVCRRVGGLDKVVDGLNEVISSLVKVSPHVIGVLNRICAPVIKWAICNIGPTVMVDGTYWTADLARFSSSNSSNGGGLSQCQ